MQNVTIAGAQYSDVPAVELQKTGGGTALFVDVSDTTATAGDVRSGKVFHLPDGSQGTGNYVWSFIGDHAEYVQDLYSYDVALEDTLYATWTPSTTAKAIVATANVGTFSANLSEYEYLIRWRCTFDGVYPAGTELKAAPVRECAELWQAIIKRPNSVANLNSSNFNSNACVTMFSAPLLVYYNTSGSLAYTYSISYGFYPAVTAATFSNSTSNTPTVTVKRPTLNARCNASYLSTTMAAAIDQENSEFKLRGELYRADVGTLTRKMYDNLVYLYNNQLS